MQTIIVSLDFTESSQSVLSYAVNLAMQLKTELTIFHAFQVPIAYSDLPVVTLSVEEIKNNAEEKLIQTKNTIQKNTEGQLKIKTELLLGEPSIELEKIANIIKPLMIVMGTGKSKALERAFVGSTTLHCINHMHIPILIIPQEAKYKFIKNIGFACDYMQVEKNTPVEEILLLTKHYEASIHVLHVKTPEETETQEMQDQKELLKRILKDINPTFHTIKDNNVEHGLHQFSTDQKIDLLITIPKKHHLLDRIFNKQHRNDIIFHSEIPILSIPE